MLALKKLCTLLLVCCSLVFGRLPETLEDLPPHTVTLSSFETFVATHPRVLINFYDARIALSGAVYHEFIRAAQIIHNSDALSTVLAIFDLNAKNISTVQTRETATTVTTIVHSMESSIPSKYGIENDDAEAYSDAFPQLRYFVNGDIDNPLTYKGGRLELGIIQWVERHELPAITAINDARALKSFIRKPGLEFVAYLPNANNGEYTREVAALEATAQHFIDRSEVSLAFGLVSDTDVSAARDIIFSGGRHTPSVADCSVGSDAGNDVSQCESGVIDGTQPRMFLYRRQKSSETAAEYTGQLSDTDALIQFLELERFAPLAEIDAVNYQLYMDRQLPMVYIAIDSLAEMPLFTDEVFSFYTPLAEFFKGVFSFVIISFNRFPSHVRRLGMPMIPGLMIVNGTNKFLFDPTGDILHSQLVPRFFDDYFAETLAVYRRAEDAEDEKPSKYGFWKEDNMHVFTGSNLDRALVTGKRHTLVAYTAKFDKASNKLLDHLIEVSNTMVTITDDIRVGRIDVNINDVGEAIDVLPQLWFYDRDDTPVQGTNWCGGGDEESEGECNDYRYYNGGGGVLYDGKVKARHIVAWVRELMGLDEEEDDEEETEPAEVEGWLKSGTRPGSATDDASPENEPTQPTNTHAQDVGSDSDRPQPHSV